MKGVDRLRGAGEKVLDERGATCCYHESDKAWVLDPDALRWETFLTHGEAAVFGESNAEVEDARAAARCCAGDSAPG